MWIIWNNRVIQIQMNIWLVAFTSNSSKMWFQHNLQGLCFYDFVCSFIVLAVRVETRVVEICCDALFLSLSLASSLLIFLCFYGVWCCIVFARIPIYALCTHQIKSEHTRITFQGLRSLKQTQVWLQLLYIIHNIPPI